MFSSSGDEMGTANLCFPCGCVDFCRWKTACSLPQRHVSCTQINHPPSVGFCHVSHPFPAFDAQVKRTINIPFFFEYLIFLIRSSSDRLKKQLRSRSFSNSDFLLENRKTEQLGLAGKAGGRGSSSGCCDLRLHEECDSSEWHVVTTRRLCPGRGACQ